LNGKFRGLSSSSSFRTDEKLPNRDWNGHSWSELKVVEPLWMIPYSAAREFSLWLCDRSRKTGVERQGLLRKLLLEVPHDEIKVPIETKLLTELAACCPYPMEFQYRVGKYRLDAFIPRLNLCIMIDEHGHVGYDPVEEREYNTVLRDHNIVCIRFDPHAKYAQPPGLELIKRVWERTLSPDFKTFRERR
jgi:hypothetical protein